MAVAFKWFGEQAKEELRRRAAERLEATGRAILGRMQAYCPVDTGYLRSTLGFTVNTSELVLRFHADASYALFVELKQPFMRPALLEAGQYLVGVGTEVQFTHLAGQYAAPAKVGPARAFAGHRGGR